MTCSPSIIVTVKIVVMPGEPQQGDWAWPRCGGRRRDMRETLTLARNEHRIGKPLFNSSAVAAKSPRGRDWR
jgi:hypothetical protein